MEDTEQMVDFVVEGRGSQVGMGLLPRKIPVRLFP